MLTSWCLSLRNFHSGFNLGFNSVLTQILTLRFHLGISQLETSTVIVNKFDACHCDSVKLVKETLSEINRSVFREDITGAKKSIEKTWNERYKIRNDLFRRHHRNKRFEELYNSELSKENPCIPRKFLPNYNGKETPEEKEIMQNLTKEKVRAELQLQKIRYERQLESIKQIDNEMTNLIISNFNENIAVILQEQWIKQCQAGELKSIQEFSKKEQWFKENWMSVSKPKHAADRDPNKQENNIQYRTYYRNEYNQDKNKRRNIYRSNTRHRGEQQRYNKNQRQDNSNNVITFKQTSNNHQNNESEEIGDTLVEVLTSINRRTWSTETIIVPKTQDNDRMNSVLVNSPSQ